MSKFIINIFIILLCLLVNNANGAMVERVDIIKGEDIRKSGLMRLSDIFLIIDNWDVSTIDGITFQASPFGLNSYQHQDWKIFLNGIPIDINLFGIKALDRIPVDLMQIVAIKILHQSGIYAGQKTAGGIIDIITKKNATGLSANLRTGFGNETGDPGPYHYTDKRSPNIDKVGNIIASGFSFGAKDSYFNFGFKREIGYPTDEAAFYRNDDIANGYYPRQKLESYYAYYRKYQDNFQYSISAGLSNFDDFYFLRSFGREVPVNSRLSYFGSTGAIGNINKPILNYRFAYTSNKLGRRENSLNLDFDWKQENLHVNIETGFRGTKFTGTAGIGLNHSAIHTDYILDKEANTEATIYTQFNCWLSQLTNFSTDLILNFQNNRSGFLARLMTTSHITRNGQISILVTYDKTLPEESNNIWYWQQQGYMFLRNHGISYTIDGAIKPTKKFTAEVLFINRLSRTVSMHLSAYYRSFAQLTCAAQYLISPTDYSAPDNLEVQTDCSGQIVGAEIGSRFDPVKKLRIELFARYQNYIDDEPMFTELWKMVPKYKLSATMIYDPVKHFSLWSRLKYTGKTKWVDYESSDTNDIHTYHTVNDFFNIDITAQKYFGNRKIRTSFSIRNLLNDKVKYHPIGAQFDLSYFAQIEFMLN